ncbi:MAG TPA: glycoside hydrolase family 2 TIM barrel-domain containing protein, partial [bacterium]
MFYKYKYIFAFISLLIFQVLCSSCAEKEFTRQNLNFNADWKFHRGELAVDEIIKMDYDDSDWQNVHLPHALEITPLRHPWPLPDNQGINWYRKKFQLSKNDEGKKTFLEFEGADQVAEIWINSEKLMTHSGSFTPFLIDISDYIYFGQSTNLVCVRVNNKRDPDIPVYGSWISYGGLYRDVYLHIMDRLHITNAIFANKIADGGIFVTYQLVSDSLAEVKIQTHIFNEYKTAKQCRLSSSILDANNNKVGSAESVQKINGEADQIFVQTIKITNPKLWHPDHPHLYTLISEVYEATKIVDIQTTPIGIRRIDFSPKDGFSINGNRFIFMGTNRVQDYPCVAWAFPNSAQRRDAIHLKEAGFQYVRLSHNLQNPSFLDACDELGILVMACIPGFQFIGGQ